MEDTQRFDQNRYRHWIEDQVRFSDLDPLGHVNNNAIGQYFENARADLFMKATPDWPNRPQLFVLARIAIDYRRELHIPAKLRIGACVCHFGRTSLTLAGAVFRVNDNKSMDGVAYCETVSVLIDRKTRKPAEIGEDIRKIFEEYAG